MAVSKHNLWKRKKNGVMKLVRSHSDWLKKRRLTRASKLNKSELTRPVVKQSSNIAGSDWMKPKPQASTSSTKRTQVGKKI